MTLLAEHAASLMDEDADTLEFTAHAFISVVPALTQLTPEKRLLAATYLVALVKVANDDGCRAAESIGAFLCATGEAR